MLNHAAQKACFTPRVSVLEIIRLSCASTPTHPTQNAKLVLVQTYSVPSSRKTPPKRIRGSCPKNSSRGQQATLTEGSHKPWFLESPLSWALEPELTMVVRAPALRRHRVCRPCLSSSATSSSGPPRSIPKPSTTKIACFLVGSL